MEIKLKLKKINSNDIPENNEAKTNIYINLPKFDISINKEQYDYIIKLLNYIFNYKQFQTNYYNSNKYHFFKPKNANLSNKKIYFRYIIKMVIKQIKSIKNNDTNIFKIPETILNIYKEKFLELYQKYYYYYVFLDPKKIIKIIF